MEELYNDIFKSDGHISKSDLKAYFNDELNDQQRNRIERILQDSDFENEAFEGFEEHPSALDRLDRIESKNPFNRSTSIWTSFGSIAAAAVVTLFVVSTQFIDQAKPEVISEVVEPAEEETTADPITPSNQIVEEPAEEVVLTVAEEEPKIEELETPPLEEITVANDISSVQEDEEGISEMADFSGPTIEPLSANTVPDAEVQATYESKALRVDQRGIDVPPGYELLMNHLIVSIDNRDISTPQEDISLSPQFSYTEEVKIREAEEDEVIEELYYEDVLRLGMESFRKSNYRAAIQSFDQILLSDDDDLNALMYKALSLYELGSLEQAEPLFVQVRTLDDSAFDEIAEWHLALIAYADDKIEGRRLLEEIRDKEGFYSKQAYDILNGY